MQRDTDLLLVNGKNRAGGAEFAVEHPPDTAWIDKMDPFAEPVKLAVTVADGDNTLCSRAGQLIEAALRRGSEQKFVGVRRTAMMHCQRNVLALVGSSGDRRQ